MKNIETADLYELFKACSSSVCTDSRSVKEGDMFFALKGENFDGNNYACAAIGKGAAYAVVDEAGIYEANPDLQQRLVLVENVLEALQQLSKYNRLRYKIPVIALTGTNGKTTTKELIAATLSVKYNVVSTAGNLNNHIGVPLTLLRINEETQAAVIEMGASAPGEIETLVNLVCPSFGLITNVGKAHLLGFGSFEGVKKTKGELYDNLARHKKIAFVNVDNPHLMEMAQQYDSLHIVPYGLKNNCVEILENEPDNPFLRLVMPNPCLTSEPARIEVRTNLIGKYNADNVLAALCISSYFDVATGDAVAAIAAYVPSNNRSQMTKTENNTLIIDAYNANPTSMRASLENFVALNLQNKVLVLGDMRELGDDSLKEHCDIVEYLQHTGVERAFLVGGEFCRAVEAVSQKSSGKACTLPLTLFADSQLLKEYLSKEPLRNKTILIKGSRGIRLERIFEAL